MEFIGDIGVMGCTSTRGSSLPKLYGPVSLFIQKSQTTLLGLYCHFLFYVVTSTAEVNKIVEHVKGSANTLLCKISSVSKLFVRKVYKVPGGKIPGIL
jgi:hypothetical protein